METTAARCIRNHFPVHMYPNSDINFTGKILFPVLSLTTNSTFQLVRPCCTDHMHQTRSKSVINNRDTTFRTSKPISSPIMFFDIFDEESLHCSQRIKPDFIPAINSLRFFEHFRNYTGRQILEQPIQNRGRRFEM
jgi:hypothetical protein